MAAPMAAAVAARRPRKKAAAAGDALGVKPRAAGRSRKRAASTAPDADLAADA
jgi:hypothetical protein